MVDRFIEQYNALYAFFEEESKSKTKKTAEEAGKIFNVLKDRYTLLYLHFMKFALPLVVSRNREFQAEKPKITRLYSKMHGLFKTVVGCYLDEEYVDRTDAELIAYSETEKLKDDNARYWVNLKNVDLGPYVSAELSCINNPQMAQRVNDFRQNFRSFYVLLATEIMNRFRFNNPSVKMLEKLEFVHDLKKFKNISEIASQFGFDVFETQNEFKMLKHSHHFKNKVGDDEFESGIDTVFWRRVRNDDEFPIMKQLIERVAVLPHSSATVERIFSCINLNKTKTRNRLSTETLIGLLHAKTVSSRDNPNHSTFRKMINLMNNTDIYA